MGIPVLWWIYTLSDNGKVFYVGISRDVKKRYKGHLSCQDMCTGDVIYWMRHEGRLPGIEILQFGRNQSEAESIEAAIIRQFCILGNKLCNCDINPIYNRMITCNPYPNRIRLKGRIKKGVVDNIIREARDRFNKLSFYYNYERKDRLQYMANAANVS